jgi:DNA-binding NtrC family response regulator
MDLEDLLANEGWTVIGPFSTVEAALDCIQESPPDAAVLDVDMAGERSMPIVAALKARGVPFVLVTGYSAMQLPEAEFEGATRIGKPYGDGELVRAIRAMLGSPTPPR